MTTLVLCNVGARDVMLDGMKIEPAREEGQRLLEIYAAVAPRLSFPIVEPCVRYILDQLRSDADQPRIEQVILYGTDQPDPSRRWSDTLFFAELAARRLVELFGDSVQRMEPRRVQDINPALYDETFEIFDALLSDLPHNGVDDCYVIICGGIPACNTALLLQGVRHYGDRLRVVYQIPGGEPQELRAGRQMVGAFREAAAIEHLRRLDFANALPFLGPPSSTDHPGVDPGLIGLIRYASQRFAFDFRSSQDTLLQTLRDGNRSTREFIQDHLRHDMDALLVEQDSQKQLAALLRELYWNAAITFQHQRYADFLGRVYRFQEAVLRYLVESVYHLPTDLSPAMRQANQALWNQGIAANSRLIAFLETQKVDNVPLEWRTIGRPTYKALLSYATSDKFGLDANDQPLIASAERGRYQALLDRINALDRLVELRHRTIVGHGFEGLSEALIHANFKGNKKPDGAQRTVIEGLAEILDKIHVDARSNPFESVAGYVTQHLRQR